MGAATENLSFGLNKALLSRAHVYQFQGLQIKYIRTVIDHALEDAAERGFGRWHLAMPEDLRQKLAEAADGVLAGPLMCWKWLATLPIIVGLWMNYLSRYCKGGTSLRQKGRCLLYDQIPALNKGVQGSAPDAALYWCCRLLGGGCDLLYLARQLVRIASGDIGNLDPRSLRIALDAWEAYERLVARKVN